MAGGALHIQFEANGRASSREAELRRENAIFRAALERIAARRSDRYTAAAFLEDMIAGGRWERELAFATVARVDNPEACP